jgi:hypothetical protein
VKFVDETESDLPHLTPTRNSRSPGSQKRKKAEGGPTTLNTLRGGLDDSDSDDDSNEDSEESDIEDPLSNGRMPEMEDWNTQMVYNSMRIRGEHKTKQALRDSGFPENEIPRILSISMAYALNRARARKLEHEERSDHKARQALMKMQRAMMLGMAGGMDPREKEKEREKPVPVFAGHGHRLVDTAKPVEAPRSSNGANATAGVAPSTFKLEFNPTAPKTLIKVRGPTGVMNVEINLTHTVRELYNHLRTLSNLSNNAPIRLYLPPNQLVEESDLSIQEAKLIGVAVILKN